MTTRTEIEQKISGFLKNNCGVDISKIDNQTSLFKGGVLNSIDIIKMVVFIENDFSIPVDVFEIGLDSFESIDAMANYIENKLSVSA